MLVPKLVVPPYDAVRLCAPTVRLDTESVATPDAFSVPVPSVAAPSLNVTVPAFGVVDPTVCVTVAVNNVLCPNTVGFVPLLRVVVVGSCTFNVPVFDAVPAWQVPPPFAASTVNMVDPGGVALVVVIVKVALTFPPVLVTEDGLNDALAPAGSALDTLKGEVQELPLPLKLTVIAYVELLPGAIGVGVCVPTVTVFGFASVNVFCA